MNNFDQSSVSEYLRFIGEQNLTESQELDLKLFALACAERVLPIFEKQYPSDSSVSDCIEKTRIYLAGGCTLDELKEYACAAKFAAYAATSVADAAATAAYAATDAVDAAAYAAYAVVVANTAHAAYNDNYTAERETQHNELLKLVTKWGW